MAEVLKVATIGKPWSLLFWFRFVMMRNGDVSDGAVTLKDMGVILDTLKGITLYTVRKKLVRCSTPSNTKIIFRTINNHDILVQLHKWREN